jgi:hypothetical protein
VSTRFGLGQLRADVFREQARRTAHVASFAQTVT